MAGGRLPSCRKPNGSEEAHEPFNGDDVKENCNLQHPHDAATNQKRSRKKPVGEEFFGFFDLQQRRQTAGGEKIEDGVS